MSNKKYLFCEGEKGSLDIQLLNKLPFNSMTTEIIPMGGKYSAGAFKNGFITALDEENPKYILFRDRDYDMPFPNIARLSPSPFSPNTYMSYCATIENYLINPKILLDYLSSEQLNQKSNIHTLQEAKRFLDDIAQELRYYAAVRYAIGQTREGFEFAKGTTWTKGSGKLPQKLDEMYCKTKAISFIEKIKTDLLAYSNVYDSTKFEDNYQQAMALFNADFIANGKYLYAFHGKDIISSMIKQFEQRKIDFDKNQYYRFALKTFDYTQFADLVELLAILNKL